MKSKLSPNFRLSQSGMSLVVILGFLGLALTAAVGLYTYNLNSRYADIGTRNVLSKSILTNGLMDYVAMSVKSQWCLTDQWQEDTKARCKNQELTHRYSIRRLISSRAELERKGENYIIQAKKGRLTDEDFAALDAGGSSQGTTFKALLTTGLPTTQVEYLNWMNKWISKIKLDEIRMTIPLNLDAITTDHPLRPLVEMNRGYYEKYGYKEAQIFIKRSHPIETPTYGREVNLDLTITIVQVAKDSTLSEESGLTALQPNLNGNSTGTSSTTNSNTESITKTTVYRSSLSASPVELNRFALLSAGDLHLESETIPAEKVKGTFIANNLSKDANPIGVHFESPVMFSQRIHLPTKESIDRRQHDLDSTVTLKPNVFFSNPVYLGFDKTSLKGETSNEILSMNQLCERPEGADGRSVAGGICQGRGIFKSSENNTLINSKLSLLEPITWLDYDKGLDYIAGPSLNGKKDGSIVGETMARCADLAQSHTEMGLTKDNQLKYFTVKGSDQEPTGKAIFYWENAAETQQKFSLRTMNRFQTPASDQPRGSQAQCYINANAPNDSLQPMIYGLRSQVSTTRRGSDGINVTANEDVFLISTTGGAPGPENIPVTIPKHELFDNQGAELGSCPKKPSVSQYESLKNEYIDKSKVIINLEFYMEVKDNMGALSKLGLAKTASHMEDAASNVFIHQSVPGISDGRFGFETIVSAVNSHLNEFLHTDSHTGNLTNASIGRDRCNTLIAEVTGSAAHSSADMIYCAKALMGYNTVLKRNPGSTSLDVYSNLNLLNNYLAEMVDFRIGESCVGASCSGDLLGNSDRNGMSNGTAKSIRYQRGQRLITGRPNGKSKWYDDALNSAHFSSPERGHDDTTVTNFIDALKAKETNLDSTILSTYTPPINQAAAMACSNVCTNSTDINGNVVNSCTMDCSARDAAKQAAESALANFKISNDYEELKSDIQYVNGVVSNINTRISQLADMKSLINGTIADLSELVSDIAVRQVTSLDKKLNGSTGMSWDLPINLGSADEVHPVSVFHPGAFYLDGGILRQREAGANGQVVANQFIQKYYLKINAFDPSSKYQVVPIQGCPGSDAAAAVSCEQKCISAEATDPTDTMVRAYVKLPNGTSQCLEINSDRPHNPNTHKYVGKFNNQIVIEYNRGSDSAVTTVTTPPTALIPDTDANPTNYSLLQSSSRDTSGTHGGHYGFYDFACALTDRFTNVLATTQSAPTSEAPIFAINGGFNEPAIFSQDFSDQTNHSWFFAPVSFFNQFIGSTADDNYVVPGSVEHKLEITQDAMATVLPLPTSGDISSGKDLNIDTDFSYKEDNFLTFSIASTCTIHKAVKIVTGFFVCREFVIEDGRTTPLQIFGTVIAGRVTIPPSAVTNGVFFKSIYHPDARRFLVDTVENCNLAIDENPTWFHPGPSADDPGRVGKQAALRECSITRYREKAIPLTWSKVDPDCGMMSQFKARNATGPQYSERMMCKSNVENYFVVEKWRSTAE